MGIFPAMWKIWLYTALFALVALLGLTGALISDRWRTKGVWAGCCLIALVALAGAYLTGFTFHLNTDAPVAADRLVYLVPNCLCGPDSNVSINLEAVRVRDGQVQWRYPVHFSGLGPSDTFISDDQRVYVERYSPDAAHLREYVITALDAHSGQQVWQVTSHVGGKLVGVANGRLTIEDPGFTLILDAATGRQLLLLPAGDAYFERDGVVYACSGVDNDLAITATDEATGHKLWTSPPVFGCGLALTPTMLIATGYSMLAAIHIKDGTLAWQVKEGQASSGPIVDGNILFTSIEVTPSGSERGVLTARSVGDGSLLWQKSLSSYPFFYRADDDVALATGSAGDSALLALRASDGKQLWSYPQADSSLGVAVIADGVVILSQSSSRQIIALDLHTGSLYWQRTL